MSRDDSDPPGEDPPGGLPPRGGGFDGWDYLFRQLNDADWLGLLPHLWRFAGYWIGKYSWPVRAAAPTADDMVSMALLKLLDRPEIWKPHIYQKHLLRKDALRAFLCILIVRTIQQERDRAYTRWRVDLSVSDGDGDADEGKTGSGGLADNSPSPEDNMERMEKASLLLRIESFCIQIGYGDEFRLRFLMDRKSEEMAREMDLPVERIYSRVAQLKVRIQKEFGEEALELLNGKLDDEGPER